MTSRLFIIAFLTTIVVLFFGQTSDQTYSVNEDIILYTDRDVYITGETIWFTAEYLVNGIKPDADLSRILYVELLSFEGQSFSRNKFKIEKNSIEGYIEIPLELQSDYYLLSAYTKYQTGNNPSEIFNQPLVIINPQIPLKNIKADDSWSFKIASLSPSGVDAEDNQFALLFNQQRIEALTEAQIVDTGNNLISEVKLFANGLGLVKIVPEFGTHYFLKTIYNFADTIYEPVSFERSGDLLYTGTDNKNLFVNLNQSLDLESTYQLEVFSQSKELLYSAKLNPSKGNPVASIALDKLSTGLNYFLLKSDKGETVGLKAEFIRPDEPKNIKVSTDKNTCQKREQFQVQIDDKNREDIRGPLTVSVVKHGTLFDGKDLPSYLLSNPELLTSFFDAHPFIDHSVKTQVKLLMAIYNLNLGSGMKDFATSNKTKQFVETRGASLTGLVRNRATKEVAVGIEIIASILGENPQLKIFTTNKQGEFIFGLDHIEDLTNVYLTINNEKADSLEILVYSDYNGELPDLLKPQLNLDTGMQVFLEDLYVNAQVTDMFGGVLDDTSSGTKAIRFSEPGETIVLDDYVSMASIELVFNELVPYTRVRKKGEDFRLEVLDSKTNMTYDSPLILVDDLPVFDVNEIVKLHPSIVEKIEVINSTYVFGDHIVKGIVLITTSTNNFGNIKLPESFTSLEFQAPASGKIIQPSEYFTPPSKNNRKPDFRNTLWFGTFNMDGQKDSLTLFAPDNASTFDIVIRGITDDGHPVFGITSLKVVE